MKLSIIEYTVNQGSPEGIAQKLNNRLPARPNSLLFFWAHKANIANLFNNLDNDYFADLMKSDAGRTKWNYYLLTEKIKALNFDQQDLIFKATQSTNQEPLTEFDLIKILHTLQQKKMNFDKRNERDASRVAGELHATLNTAFDDYLNKIARFEDEFKVNISKLENLEKRHRGFFTVRYTLDDARAKGLETHELEYFNKCEEAVKELTNSWEIAVRNAKPELEKYRGWGNFLANLLLIIPTLGLSMVYAHHESKGESVLFPILTSDATKLVTQLQQIGIDAKLTINAEPDNLRSLSP